MVAGGSGGQTLPLFNPSVTVDATTTLGSGGGADWWGRSAMERRASDRAIVLAYYRSTGHTQNDGFVHMKFSDDEAASWTAEDTTLLAATIPDFIPADATGSQDPGEPWLYRCPNDDLLLHTWRVDYGSDDDGSYQWRSTDEGETWVAEGKINFTGGTLSSLHTFSTDDDFVYDGVIYAGVRTYTSASYVDCHLSLVKSSDNGVTWDYVSDVTTPSEVACIEFGMEYVGNNTIIAMIRDLAHTKSYKRVSTDMGLTWGTLTEMQATIGIAARQRVYTFNHLLGLPGWWKDPRLVMVGYTQDDPGNSQERTNAIWLSPDRGATWDGPHDVDTTSEDGGYGDIVMHPDGTFTVVNYRGTLTAASLKQYDLTVDLVS